MKKQMENGFSKKFIGKNDSWKLIHKYTLLQLKNNMIACSMYDSIKLWNLQELEHPITFNPTQLQVQCIIQLENSKIAFASNDTILIWDLSSYLEQYSLQGHTDEITSLIQLKDGTLLSASNDKTMKIWNVNNKQCLLTNTHNDKEISCLLQLKDGTIATGGIDNHVKIWNSKFFYCRLVLNTSSQVYSLLQLRNEQLITGLNKKIVIWDIYNNQCLKIINHHIQDKVVCLIQLKHEHFALCFGNIVQIWNTNRWKCKTITSNDDKNIMSMIQLTDGRLATINTDRQMKFWTV